MNNLQEQEQKEMEDELNFVSDIVRSPKFDLGFRTGYVTAEAKFSEQIKSLEAERDKLMIDYMSVQTELQTAQFNKETPQT